MNADVTPMNAEKIMVMGRRANAGSVVTPRLESRPAFIGVHRRDIGVHRRFQRFSPASLANA
jgi:hypothetical protein